MRLGPLGIDTMVRFFLLALVLANAAYFAWSDGLLAPYGFAPDTQREPQRLAQQIQPQALRVLSPAEFQALQTQISAAQAPRECLTLGPFDEAQTAIVRKALDGALPAGAWQLNASHIAPRWIIYMGPYTSADMLSKKRAELATLNLHIDALNNPALEPGFSLGGFETKALADAELLRLNGRGIHTAHVVQELQESTAYQLRLPAADAAQKARLADLRVQLGNRLPKPCS